jgi:hypothetical protein
MSNQEELLTVEAQTEHALVMGRALEELNKCPNFQKLILEGYLKEKVLASTSLLAVPQIKAAGQRPDVMEDLISASNLSFFLQTVQTDFEGALDPVLSDEEREAQVNYEGQED